MKKLLALVLALVMTLSLATVSSNAAFKDAKDINENYAEAAAVLNGLGVFKGYAENDDTFSFKPQGDITRAEVAAIVYRIYTQDVKDTYAKNYETYNKFSDMAGAGWAKGYIGYCANAAFIKGYPDGTFKPLGKVTGYEALAMILRAVGYDQKNEFTGADWQLHVAQIAEQNKILQNVKGVDLNKAATRELVAELLFQAIQIPMVTYTAAFGYQNVSLSSEKGQLLKDNVSLGSKNFGLDCYEGYVIANAYDKKYSSMIVDGKNANKESKKVKVADQDIFDAGRYGHVWTSDGSAITDVFYDDTLLSTSYTGAAIENLTEKKTGNTDYVADFAKENMVVYNGNENATPVVYKGTEVAMYSIDGKTISSIIVVNPIVDYMAADYLVKNDKVKIQGKTFDKDDISGYEDLVKDDVFTYVDMADGVRYFEELEAIAGQKSAYTEPKKGDAYITFDSKDYEQSGLKGTSDKANLFSKVKDTFDKDGYVYLDRGGFVVYTSWTADATPEYGMVIDAYKVLNDKHNGNEYYVNLLKADGTETGYVSVNTEKSTYVDFADITRSDIKKTTSPETVADYEGFGTLVKYTVKDDVYTLVEASSCGQNGARMDEYKKGAATMKINGERLALVEDSTVFFYWYEEVGASKFVAHYGVNVGKGNIPSYSTQTSVKYLEKDGECLEAASFNGMTKGEYDDYAYIYSYSKKTTTSSKLDIYTYYGVNSEGKAIEFKAYPDFDGFYGEAVEGHVVWYLEREDGMAEFGPADNTHYSLALMSSKNENGTVKARAEGKNTDWDTFMNADVVYDLTDTSKLGETADTYTFYWDKTVRALLVMDETDDTDDYVVKCAFVINDNVKYGDLFINAQTYWLPVYDTAKEEAIPYSLNKIDAAEFTADKYHVIDKTGKNEIVAKDALYTFEAWNNGTGNLYTTYAHNDVADYTITAKTGYTLSADGKTLTVPYATDLTSVSATDLVNITTTDSWQAVYFDGKITITFSANEKASPSCTKTVVIDVVKTAANYALSLSMKSWSDGTNTYVELKVDTDNADVKFDLAHGGKIAIVQQGNRAFAANDITAVPHAITAGENGHYYAIFTDINGNEYETEALNVADATTTPVTVGLK